MKKNIILLQLLLPVLSVTAQMDTIQPVKKSKPSIAIVKTMDGKKTTGWFYKMDDDHVYLIPAAKRTLQHSDYNNSETSKRAVPIEALQLNMVTLKKKNAGLKGALIGLGSGAAIGAIIGLASGDDPYTPYTGTLNDIGIAFQNAFAMTAGEKAVAGAASGGLIGALTGAIIGVLVKKKFVIGGKKETYRNLQSELMQRAIIK